MVAAEGGGRGGQGPISQRLSHPDQSAQEPFHTAVNSALSGDLGVWPVA